MTEPRAPRPAATLYEGHVMHARLIPKAHRFRYRVFSILVDIDRIAEIARKSRFLRHNRFGLLSLMDKDHGARDGSSLRVWADGELARAGLERAARIDMLSFPRMLGYGFNPLTVYYCHDAQDALYAVIYEVKNTYGDQIAYTLPTGPRQGGSYRQRQGKEMYVSPFIDMDQEYRFTVDEPGEKLALRIRQAGPEGETLIATHTAQGKEMSDARLFGAFLGHPLLTFRVIALIHWHALRLVLKGIRFRPYDAAQKQGKHLA